MPQQNPFLKKQKEQIKPEEQKERKTLNLGDEVSPPEEMEKSEEGREKKAIQPEKEKTAEGDDRLEKAEELLEKKVDQQQTKRTTNDDQDDDEDNGDKKIKESAEEISQLADAETQIDKLVELAMQKDPYVAIKVARHLDNNYVLDKLHDELVEEKVRKVLVEKGLLKEL